MILREEWSPGVLLRKGAVQQYLLGVYLPLFRLL